MAIALTGHIDLPPHRGPRAFDHAAVHGPYGRLFVAHTANDALDVVDVRTGRHLLSVPDLTEVAGVVVSPDDDLVFTTNRGEDTVGVLRAGAPEEVRKIAVGHRPNGLAYDPTRRRLLSANKGHGGGATFTIVDVARGEVVAELAPPGGPRWGVYDPRTDRFYVNVADPDVVAVVDPAEPRVIERQIGIGVAGPHGIDLDPRTGRLFVACDGGQLVAVDAASGGIVGQAPISGVPDAVFVHPGRRSVYVAIGDPGVVDVFDADSLERRESCPTERGAKTTAIDPENDRLYVFLPETHRAAILVDA